MKLQSQSSQEFLSARPVAEIKSACNKQKNIFTISDSRYKYIKNLESKNKQLTSKLTELESDLQQIDEFKIAIQIDRQSNKQTRSLIFNQIDVKKGKLKLETEYEHDDFHQKRVEILKAQLLKQQRYIKRLTTILQTTRKFYEDLKEYLTYFGEVLRNTSVNADTYSLIQKELLPPKTAEPKLERMKSIQKIKQPEIEIEDSFDRQQSLSKVNRITKPSEMIDLVDKKQNYISLKQLLAQFKSNEERDNFISTFSSAYSKVLEFERTNVDFKSLFETQRKFNGQSRLIYKHPIRNLIKQYGGYFPIKSIYTAFPMKDRERLEHFLFGLRGMASQIQRDLTKVDTFYLFQSNPFFFQSKENKLQVDLPINMLEEQQVYDLFLQEPEKHRVINLDQEMLQNVEQSLLTLMDQLFELQKYYHQELLKPQYLQNSTYGKLTDQIRKALESLICISSMIGNNNQNTINKIYIVNNKEAYLYQQQIFNQNDFDFKYQQLEQLLDDLSALVEKQELSIVKKAIMLMKSLKNTFDVQKMITTIRESEINFLRQKINLILMDYEGVNEYITQIEKKFKQFYGCINQKFQTAINQFNLILEQDKLYDVNIRKQFGQSFKKTLKDIQDYIQSNMEYSRQENRINMMQIQQDFDKKVSTFYVRSEALLKMNEQLLRRMQQQ